MATPIPDRAVVEKALQYNTDIQKLTRRLLKVAKEYDEAKGEETNILAVFPSVESVQSRLSALNEDAKILRRQLRLIDDYEGTFGEKKGSPDDDREQTLVIESNVALAS